MTPDRGDVLLADLGDERRRAVVVLSSARFHRLAGRAFVAPAEGGPPDAVRPPWRVPVGDAVFAVDHLRSVRVDRLLDTLGRATASELRQLQRAWSAPMR